MEQQQEKSLERKYAFSSVPMYEHKTPEFIENNGEQFIINGTNNEYPDYLTYLYNRCGLHHAIVNGKVDKTDKYLSNRRKAIAANLKEGDHEVSMAQSSLKSIIKSAVELHKKLGNMERNIPGWIQDHITNAENYIDQAAQGFHELKDDE